METSSRKPGRAGTGRRRPPGSRSSPIDSHVVLRTAATIASAGGRTHQVHEPLTNASGLLNAQLSIVPQLRAAGSPSPRNASVASAKMAKRTVSTSLAGNSSSVAGATWYTATRIGLAPSTRAAST